MLFCRNFINSILYLKKTDSSRLSLKGVFSIWLKISADVLVACICLDHLKYVPGLLEYSLTVQYATSILHVHGCPGKQIDEGYRMMYVTLILNTALSYIGRSAKHYIAEGNQPWWIELHRPPTDQQQRGAAVSQTNIETFNTWWINKHTDNSAYLCPLYYCCTTSLPLPLPHHHLKEKITGLCSQY